MNLSYPVALWLACLLDLLVGDPRRLPHPVRLIGRLCVFLETLVRTRYGGGRIAGAITAILVLLSTAAASSLVLAVLWLIHPGAALLGAVLMLYTTIAIRDLLRHAGAVHLALMEQEPGRGDPGQARARVAMLVGRDTDHLDEAGIVRACVESVAENMADGIVAPVFWSFAGAVAATAAGAAPWAVPAAAVAAMAYKAANTMDSMFGYKNDRYLHFGWFAARFDDLVNLVPARLAGLCIVLAAPVAGTDPAGAWRMLCRDRRNHTSPNAGFPEAAMAGALGIRLGGPSRYFGKLQEKPFLGDPVHPPRPDHILAANRLVLAGSLLACGLFSLGFAWLTP